MIKKALVATVIEDYIDAHGLNSPQLVLDNAQGIFNALKVSTFGDLTDGCPFQKFVQQIQTGYAKSQMGGNVRFHFGE